MSPYYSIPYSRKNVFLNGSLTLLFLQVSWLPTFIHKYTPTECSILGGMLIQELGSYSDIRLVQKRLNGLTSFYPRNYLMDRYILNAKPTRRLSQLIRNVIK